MVLQCLEQPLNGKNFPGLGLALAFVSVIR